ncbi:hypothetical protein TNCV_408211 [Trichonephila clavipes]|nr:hypothetical protein TNCV_408211 [Trichonephila clavipes]
MPYLANQVQEHRNAPETIIRHIFLARTAKEQSPSQYGGYDPRLVNRVGAGSGSQDLKKILRFLWAQGLKATVRDSNKRLGHSSLPPTALGRQDDEKATSGVRSLHNFSSGSRVKAENEKRSNMSRYRVNENTDGVLRFPILSSECAIAAFKTWTVIPSCYEDIQTFSQSTRLFAR